MKLRNKKTGEIGYLIVGRSSDNYHICNEEWESCGKYYSLAELNEEWQDYEEPETVWYIDYQGVVRCAAGEENNWFKESEIGNHFETKEEAEKAVEKLKAWKRLKDKGVEFYGWRKNHTGTYEFLARWKGVPPRMCEIINDLNLLFGGEE